jgi:hypothetical protein
LRVYIKNEEEEFLLTEVDLMHPYFMRDEAFKLLQIDSTFRIIGDLDLGFFASAKDQQSLYWNLLFWFEREGLPVSWMAHYVTSAVYSKSLSSLGSSVSESSFSSKKSLVSGEKSEEFS